MDSKEISELAKFDFYFPLCRDNVHVTLGSKHLVPVQIAFEIQLNTKIINRKQISKRSHGAGGCIYK